MDVLYATLGISIAIATLKHWEEWPGIGSFYWLCIFIAIICISSKHIIRICVGDELPFDTCETGVRIRWITIRSVGVAFLLFFMLLPDHWLNDFYDYASSSEHHSNSVYLTIYHLSGVFGLALCLLPLYRLELGWNNNRSKTRQLTTVIATVLGAAFLIPVAYDTQCVRGLIHIACTGIELGMAHPAEMQLGMRLPQGENLNQINEQFVSSTYTGFFLALTALFSMITGAISTSRVCRTLMAAVWLASVTALTVSIQETIQVKLPTLGAQIENYYASWPETNAIILIASFCCLTSLFLMRRVPGKQPMASIELENDKLTKFQFPIWFSRLFLVSLLIEAYLTTEYPRRFIFFDNDSSWIQASNFSPISIGYSFATSTSFIAIWTIIFAMLGCRQLTLASRNNSTAKFVCTGKRRNLIPWLFYACCLAVSMIPIAIAFINLGFGATLTPDSTVTTFIFSVSDHMDYAPPIGKTLAIGVGIYFGYQLWKERRERKIQSATQ